MDLSTIVLPAAWTLGAWLVAAPLFIWAAVTAPWPRFASSEAVHVWYGSILAVTLLWSIRATVAPDFTFHLLGAAALALTSGGPLALFGGAIVVALTTLIRDAPIANAAIVWLVEIAIPAGVALATLRLAERLLPPNFFVYVFVATFFGAALAFGVTALTGATVQVLGAGDAAALVFGEYLPYMLYLAFGEAMLTGMLVVLAIVYRPHWVATFDDRRYLHGR